MANRRCIMGERLNNDGKRLKWGDGMRQIV